MKKFAIILLSLTMVGCATNPEKVNQVASEESSYLSPPSVNLNTYDNFELLPMEYSDGVLEDQRKVDVAKKLEDQLYPRLNATLAGWSDSSSDNKLVIQPRIVTLRVISGGARFWAGALSGDSSISMSMQLMDSNTQAIIANPTITRSSNSIAGAFSFGKSDKNLLEYITEITNQYLVDNYN